MSQAQAYLNLINLDDEELTRGPLENMTANAKIFDFGNEVIWIIFPDYTSLLTEPGKQINHVQDDPKDFPEFLFWLGSDESPLPQEAKDKISHSFASALENANGPQNP